MTAGELDGLAARLRRAFEERFREADLDLSIGRMQWLLARGIGFEINGEWDSVTSARRSLIGRWKVVRDADQLETAVSDKLEAALKGGTAARNHRSER